MRLVAQGVEDRVRIVTFGDIVMQRLEEELFQLCAHAEWTGHPFPFGVDAVESAVVHFVQHRKRELYVFAVRFASYVDRPRPDIGG